MRKHLFIILCNLMLAVGILCGCSTSPSNVMKIESMVPMYPDYTNITIPSNIAPLNFVLRGDVSQVCVYINNEEFYNEESDEVRFDLSSWKKLMKENEGKSINVRVVALDESGWKEYPSFTWNISEDQVDPYLTYTLHNSECETGNEVIIQERCVENFNQKNLCDYNISGNINPSSFMPAWQDGNLSVFAVNGEESHLMLNKKGIITEIETELPASKNHYGSFSFSPNKQYVAFCTSMSINVFHSTPSNRPEIIDTRSSIYVADIKNNRIISSPFLNDSIMMHTSPSFSPDGHYIYYCEAHKIDSISQVRNLKYSLCRVKFDENTGAVWPEMDTLYTSRSTNKSVSCPAVSPDGKYIAFTTTEYGANPFYHNDAEICIMNIKTRKVTKPANINSKHSDAFVSWSSNSKWVVFESTNNDGICGKPFFAHIDASGNVTKPFVLPQKHPSYYDNSLKSFHTPQQSKGSAMFSSSDIKGF